MTPKPTGARASSPRSLRVLPASGAVMAAIAVALSAYVAHVVDPAAQARLDQSLAAFESPPLPMHLRTAILAAVRADSQSRRAAWRAALLALWHELGGARVAAPVFALALAAGIGLGSGLMPATGPGDGIDDLLTLALIDDTYLALAPDWSGNVP